jgi:hypothetical protein
VRAVKEQQGMATDDDCSIRDRLAKITAWSQQLRQVHVPDYDPDEVTRSRHVESMNYKHVHIG